mgnify:CR=1 FL=1
MIYVASKAQHGREWVAMREAGVPIISTWIDQSDFGVTDWSELWLNCIAEASSANALVLIRRPRDIIKGAWVEVGAALGNNVPVFAVGIENYSIRHHPLVTLCSTEAEAFNLARLK